MVRQIDVIMNEEFKRWWPDGREKLKDSITMLMDRAVPSSVVEVIAAYAWVASWKASTKCEENKQEILRNIMARALKDMRIIEQQDNSGRKLDLD